MSNLINLVIFIVACIVLLMLFKDNTEKFTTLVGLNPMTTYDDYGTFNFLFHTDDLPYYNPKYENLGCSVRTYPNTPEYIAENAKTPGKFRQSVIPRGSFIDFQGDKVRRELVPENYSRDLDYSDANFKTNHMYINKKNPRLSMYAPVPMNEFVQN